MNKQNNSRGFIMIFVVIGIIMIVSGFNMIIKKMTYTETIGTFTHSEHYIYEDDDGDEHDRYRYYYNYYVNDELYVAHDSGHFTNMPSNYEEIVLYNSSNPSEYIMKSDNSGMINIIFGAIFGGIPLAMTMPNKRAKFGEMSIEQEGRYEAKKFAYIWLAFSIGVLLIICVSSGSIFDLIYGPSAVGVIFILLFIGIGIYLLKDANNPNKIFITYKHGSTTTIRSIKREEYENQMLQRQNLFGNNQYGEPSLYDNSYASQNLYNDTNNTNNKYL